jgi:uncharacterized protein DUF6754
MTGRGRNGITGAPVGRSGWSVAAALAGLLLCGLLALASAPALARFPETSPTPPPELPTPLGFAAVDRPGDTGNAVLLTWKDPPAAPRDVVLEIRRSEPPAYEWSPLASVALGTQRYVDATAKDGSVYRYEIRARATETPDSVGIAGRTGAPALSDPVTPHDNWFRTERANSLIFTVVFLAAVLGSIFAATSGKDIFIRKIAGLNAVDEAIGRATEIGKKVMFIPGIQSVDDIQTIAALAILGHVARATARYGTDLDVPNRDPLTFVSARETVRDAYLMEGRPDLYREEMVNYVTYDQFAFTAAVSGRMVRERPAANFLIGYFFAESLILAESGQASGAIQIAGTADPAQLPFFVAACDYTLIGEELYAAGAYLTREPILLGSIRGQDITKGLLILWGLVGILASSLGLPWFAEVIKTQ